VSFDGTGSADPGGSIVNAQWDFDGDNGFGEVGAELAAEGDLTPPPVSFSTAGFKTVRLRVIDDDGVAATASVSIVTHGWSNVPVDAEENGDVGTYCVLALINGNPAIAYRDEENNAVKYAHSASATGLQPGDWSVVTVNTTGLTTPGIGISLANVWSRPAICHCDSVGGSLSYQRANDADGIGIGVWPEPVLVQSSGDCGYNCQLSMVIGAPAIIFDNLSSGQLMYAHSATQSGSSPADWSTVIPLEGDADNFSNNGALAVVNGQPAYTCSHYNGTGLELHYCRSSTPAGDSAADWEAKTILPFAAAESCLALISGRPAIAFRDSTGTLGFAPSLDDDGVDWSSFCFPETERSGLPLGLAQIQGNPALAFYDETQGDLIYVRSSTSQGTAAEDWSDKAPIAGLGGDCGSHLSFCRLTNGMPALAYRDETAKALFFAAWL
jgi:hypothetical protein